MLPEVDSVASGSVGDGPVDMKMDSAKKCPTQTDYDDVNPASIMNISI